MILDRIIQHKRQEVEARKTALPVPAKSNRAYQGGLIAEIKRKSPSEDYIGDVDPVKQTLSYERAGASAISVLCDHKFFGGSLDDMQAVSDAVQIPVLCKDFIIDSYQIYEARHYGADLILLIAATLSTEQMTEFIQIAGSLGMQCLCEIHNQGELQKVLQVGAKIIGINNRNLKDFSINLNLARELADQIPSNIIKVAESGIQNFSDIPANVDGILVGTSIMRAPFPDLKIKELLGQPLLKLCGIRDEQSAKLCEELGVDMVGLNFVTTSKRKIQNPQAIRAQLKNTKAIGIFQNQSLEEVNQIAKQYDLDLIQLSGQENYAQKCCRPVIKGIQMHETRPSNVAFTLIDGATPGSGQTVDYGPKQTGVILAGGINPANAEQILQDYQPLGIDLASGIETNGQIDPDKIKKIVNIINSTQYVA